MPTGPEQVNNPEHTKPAHPRRKFLKWGLGTVAGGGVVAAGIEAGLNWETIVTWFDRFQAAAEFKANGVWDELQAFLHPLTDEEIEAKVYNPDGILHLTPQNLQNLLIVSNGDSMNLEDGERRNSLGPYQPRSWLTRYVANLESTADLLSIEHHIQGLNYAQPGAAGGLVRYQSPAGNVQLGATSVEEMGEDHAGETPPVQAMINHDGDVIAEIAMNGDHLRGAVDVFMKYYTNNVEFKNFCESPSENKLTANVKNALIDILSTYKKNIQELHDDFEKALKIYEYINEERAKKKKSPLRVICALPINYRYAQRLPYQPLNADVDRQSGNFIDLEQIPNAKAAALRVTTSYYETLNPLLAESHQRSGMEIITVPLFNLSQNPELFGPDGHLNEEGQKAFGDLVTAKTAITPSDATRREIAA